MRHLNDGRRTVLAAVNGAGDLDAAQVGAQHAVAAQAAGWQQLAGDALYTAASASGDHLTSAVQAAHPAGQDIAAYNPDANTGHASAVTPWIANHAPQLAVAVQQHTRDMLAARLSDAALTASSTDDLANAVNDLYDQWTGLDESAGDYAGMLAGDWNAMGWSHGAWDAAYQLGASTGDTGGAGVVRTWVTVGDNRVRPEHAAADGQQVGLSEPFDVGGEQLMYPADPSGSAAMVDGCRCGVDYSVDLSGIAGGTVDDQGA